MYREAGSQHYYNQVFEHPQYKAFRNINGSKNLIREHGTHTLRFCFPNKKESFDSLIFIFYHAYAFYFSLAFNAACAAANLAIGTLNGEQDT